MIKKALLVVTGLGLTTLVLFGRDAASYVSTTYNRLTSTVTDNVPTEFQIDRAKQMVRDLEPEIRRAMRVPEPGDAYVASARAGLEASERLVETLERPPLVGLRRRGRGLGRSRPWSSRP